MQAFYLPWAMLGLDVVFGSPLVTDLLVIIAGHLYYFLPVLHPLSGGRNILKTPFWVYPFWHFNSFNEHQITFMFVLLYMLLVFLRLGNPLKAVAHISSILGTEILVAAK